MSSVYLTKSRYISGLQCLRRLWLDANAPPASLPPPPGSVRAIASEIGRMAQDLFPGGVLVREPPSQHGRALVQTANRMADKKVPAILEAAFEYGNIRLRTDIWNG
jgi:hypothetical protein